MNFNLQTVLVLVVLCQQVILCQSDEASLLKTPCDIRLSINIGSSEVLADGSIVHDNITYPTTLQFVDTSSGIKQRRGCICRIKNCVRKCCPVNQSIAVEDFTPVCVNSSHEFTHVVSDGNGKEIANAFKDFGIVYGNPCVNEERYPLDPEEYRLLQNGSLQMLEPEEIVDVLEYCMDYVDEVDGPPAMVKPLQCFYEADDSNNLKFGIYPIGMILSIPFLIATFIVYLILPELQTLHGKSLMNYIAGLAVAYTFLSIVQLGNMTVSSSSCVPIGLTIYYSFMFSFFWLNVISFDIWWTFSGCGGFRSQSRTSGVRKFIYYSLYAWGATTIAFIITVALHHDPNVPNRHKPGFGVTKCWLADAALFAYFYLPVVILIVINIVLFSLTAFKIFASDRDTEMLRREGSNRHSKLDDDKQRFWLYVKLFLIMGVNWSLEILSWAVGGPMWFWIITDIVNTMQGVLIFFLFVFKPKIKDMVIRRYNTWRGRPITSGAYRSANSTDSTQMTSVHMNRNGNSTTNTS